MAAVGLPAADAARVAELMVEADLTGADAHGVFRLPQYVRRIRGRRRQSEGRHQDRKDRRRRPRWSTATTAWAIWSCRAPRRPRSSWRRKPASPGSAPSAATTPARPASMPRCRSQQDMIGIYSVVANANHMPVWGSSENLLGTNPIAFAVPAGEEAPVVLDIATTVVSYGTVKANKLQGKPMPPGWMIDKQGQPLTDSAKSAEGLLLPIGGHKGSGLALVLGLARRHAQRRGVRARRDRLQLRRQRRLRHRPFHRRARRQPLPADRGVQGRGRPPPARSEVVARPCRASRRSGCPASSARRAAPSARATAFRSIRR